MTSAVHINPERPDQPEVGALLAQLDAYLLSLYPPEANHILDVQALLAPEVLFLVARQAGKVVGTAAVRRMPGEPATNGQAFGEIKRMMVSPAARGQGIGAQLLLALEDALREEGSALALLETGADQIEAVRLYERGGYRRCAAFGGYVDNGLSVFYAKALLPQTRAAAAGGEAAGLSNGAPFIKDNSPPPNALFSNPEPRTPSA